MSLESPISLEEEKAQIESVPTMGRRFVGTVLSVQKDYGR